MSRVCAPESMHLLLIFKFLNSSIMFNIGPINTRLGRPGSRYTVARIRGELNLHWPDRAFYFCEKTGKKRMPEGVANGKI